MIIDSSAIIAIVQDEPGSEDLLRLAATHHCRMSTATWVELGIVADLRSTTHGARVDRVLAQLEVDLVDVTQREAAVAREAYRRFGRGSGSPARLTFGDCFSYALAVTTGEPLLYVGDGFSHTDVRRAV